MKMTNGGEILIAGIDFRYERPVVCFQTAQMKEPELLAMELGEQPTRSFCFRKILSLLRHYGKKEELRAAMVLPDMSEETIRLYEREACEAGFEKDRLQVLGETESVVHFVMHQTNDIWQQQVWLLEFGAEEIRMSAIEVNKRTTPMLTEVLEPEYWHVGSPLEGNRDEELSRILKEKFKNTRVSAVFLTGTDLNEREYKKSREELCGRRRVFLGEQIHARGACVLAGESGRSLPYLFLSEQTLRYNVGVRSRRAGKETVYTLVSAGCSWYEAQASCEMILLGEPVLEFEFRPMLGGETRLETMLLPDMPERPERTGRLLVEIRFLDPAQCEVRVTDLGFGELYPASDLCWTETFLLDGKEGDGDESGYGLQV